MKRGISQEGLKLFACVTMLCDHVGHAIVYPMTQESALMAEVYLLLRIIGRLAFPIYCFLLWEGFCHTHSRVRYALRLAAGALLAELPYDLMVSGTFSWENQSVMVTLLLGFAALMVMEQIGNPGWKAVSAIPFALAATWARCDYGWVGILLIALFALSRAYSNRNFIRGAGMLLLFHQMPGSVLMFGQLAIPVQALGALSMLFIANYDGRKQTQSKVVQLGFYLFYPVHMLVLWLISLLLLPQVRL